MGMTDKQFALFNRHLYKRMKHYEKLLEDIRDEELKAKLITELEDIMEDLERAAEE